MERPVAARNLKTSSKFIIIKILKLDADIGNRIEKWLLKKMAHATKQNEKQFIKIRWV